MANYELETRCHSQNVASVALGANIAVVLGATGWALPTAKGRVDGVTDYSVAIGETPVVKKEGIKIATAGAAVAVGAELEVTATGKFIELTTTGSPVAVGKAFTSASADGDKFSITFY